MPFAMSSRALVVERIAELQDSEFGTFVHTKLGKPPDQQDNPSNQAESQQIAFHYRDRTSGSLITTRLGNVFHCRDNT